MTNPTSGADVSDSAGWFPQIFMAEGVAVDVTLKNAAGSTIRTELNVTSLGAGSSTFTRDFGNSRARIAGSGGVVRYEAGDAAGDDVGGQVVLGGYNGTQADTISLDGAAVDTTGTFTENGKSLPGVVYGTGAVTAASQMIIPLSNAPSGVRAWDLDLIDLAAGGNVSVQISIDNGSTYISATNYNYTYQFITGGAASFAGTTGAASAIITETPASLDDFTLRVVTVPSGTGRTRWYGIGGTSNGLRAPIITSGAYAADVARATHLRIFPSAGTITGKWRLIPIRGIA
jgi:hypothetical protein